MPRQPKPQAPAWDSPDFEGTKEQRAEAMAKVAVTLADHPVNTYDFDNDLDLMRMYEQRPLTTLYQYAGRYFSSNALTLSTVGPTETSSQNYLRAVVNTAHAMIARSKVRGRFLTANGNGKQKNRARDATLWL